jgi:purine-binding chemotaxis protein CheW
MPEVVSQHINAATIVPSGTFESAAGAASPTEFISFAIGDEQYGVDIMAVREIKGWAEITHLPKQPDYVRGVLNLRGAIVPIVDLRCRFGQGQTETSPLHIVIIVLIGGRQVGLIGDRVLDIVAVEANQIQPVPRHLASQWHRLSRRLGDPRKLNDRADQSAQPAVDGRRRQSGGQCESHRSGATELK